MKFCCGLLDQNLVSERGGRLDSAAKKLGAAENVGTSLEGLPRKSGLDEGHFARKGGKLVVLLAIPT